MVVRRTLSALGLSAVLLAVPATAFAQDTGIGDSDSVECTGTVSVNVVDLDGTPVGGAVLMVGGQQVAGAGAVSLACGEVTAALLVAPDGYAAAGPTDVPVRVANGTTTSHTFTVDTVEVLGTQFEQPEPAPEDPQPEPRTNPAPETDSADPDADGAAQTLPETGPAQAEPLLLLALVLALLGTLLVGVTPAATPDRHDRRR